MKFDVGGKTIDVGFDKNQIPPCYVVQIEPQSPNSKALFVWEGSDVYVYWDLTFMGYQDFEKFLPDIKIALGMYCSIRELSE